MAETNALKKSTQERLRDAYMGQFTSVSARYASYGGMALHVAAFAYCVKRFYAKPFGAYMCLFMAVDVVASLCFVSLFKDLRCRPYPQHFFRVLLSTLYGACHAVVLLNILDRAFQRNGVAACTSACLIAGGNTMRDFVNFFGFKLKTALFASLRDRTSRGAYCRARIVSGLAQTATMLYAATYQRFAEVFVAGYFASFAIEAAVLEVSLRRVD